jgi:GntR family transcriptional regulator
MAGGQVPVSQRIAAELREAIESGGLPPGALLPSERELMERYKTTKSTVGKAVGILRAEGLVTSQVGRGLFVRAPRPRLRRHHSERYQWEKDRARLSPEERSKTGATEFDTGLELPDLAFRAEYSTVQANKRLADRFGIQVGASLLKRDYFTSSRSENAPLNIVHSYLVYDVVAANPDLLKVDNEPWPGGTQSQLYSIGIELDRIVDEITARPPLPDESRILALEAGVSVLVLLKTSIDINGRVVEFSEVILPGDRTEILYTTQLKRWDA